MTIQGCFQGLHCRADLGLPSWVKPRTLIDLGAKLTRDQEQPDAALKQHAVKKSVFVGNFQDVSEPVDALQRAIVVVSARSDANGMALLQRHSKTETAMHRVRLPDVCPSGVPEIFPRVTKMRCCARCKGRGTLPNKLWSGLKCLRTHEEVALPSIHHTRATKDTPLVDWRHGQRSSA